MTTKKITTKNIQFIPLVLIPSVIVFFMIFKLFENNRVDISSSLQNQTNQMTEFPQHTFNEYGFKENLPDSWKDAVDGEITGGGFGPTLEYKSISYALKEPLTSSPGYFRSYYAMINIFHISQKEELNEFLSNYPSAIVKILGENNKYIFVLSKHFDPANCDSDGNNCNSPSSSFAKAWEDISNMTIEIIDL